jgi:hypothetical protein
MYRVLVLPEAHIAVRLAKDAPLPSSRSKAASLEAMSGVVFIRHETLINFLGALDCTYRCHEGAPFVSTSLLRQPLLRIRKAFIIF